MARLTLKKDETVGVSYADFEIIGTNDGHETVNVLGGKKITLDASFNRGGDTIVLAGSASDYTAHRNGSTIVLVKGETEVSIPVGTTGATVEFDDAEFTLVYNTGSQHIELDGEEIGTEPVELSGSGSGGYAGVSRSLTTGQDNLTGTSGDDTFTARIFDNSNTLQSGDRITDSSGDDEDVLEADIGDSQNFAITPETHGIEQAVFRVETEAYDKSDNNLDPAYSDGYDLTGWTQVDAERMVGVNHWESNNSRSDLVIEDVRILDDEITKDITVAMVQTDPGHVDFGVYFDQYSLRAAAPQSANSTLVIRLRDTLADEDEPLGNLSVDGVRFSLDGTTVTLRSAEIDAAKTYGELVAALNKAIAATPGAEGLSASLGPVGTSINTVFATHTAVVVKDAHGREIGTPTFLYSENQTGDFVFAGQTTVGAPSVVESLITSTVILDDVGRGSTGGDLVIGGLSVGDTSHSKGVERFEVTVERTSRLQVMSSTNDTLREVTVENGTKTGDLWLLGRVGDKDDQDNEALPGSAVAHDAELPQAGYYAAGFDKSSTTWDRAGTRIDAVRSEGFGLSDVRLFDASDMEGNVRLTADLSRKVVGKYLDRVDDETDPAADNVSFVYELGSGNDQLAMHISDANLAAAGTTTREDFELVVKGNDGKDVIETLIGNGQATKDDAWYVNSLENANLSVHGGSGDDVIRTWGAGAWQIDGGDDDDTIYTDNSGRDNYTGSYGSPYNAGRATWVFNTADQTSGDTVVAQEIDDLITGDNQSWALYKSTLTVSFRGLVAEGITLNKYTYTNLQINQAIKDVINGDPVLSKLLVAEDGPGNTLIVRSLIDGQEVEGNLHVAIDAPDAEALESMTAAQINAFNAALGLYGDDAAADSSDVHNIVIGNDGTYDVGALDAEDAYAEAFANDRWYDSINDVFVYNDLVGSDSHAVNANTVAGGQGDDVIVLGTFNDPGSCSSETVEFEADAADNGIDTIVNFKAGAHLDNQNVTLQSDDEGTLADGGDVFDVQAFLCAEVDFVGEQDLADDDLYLVDDDGAVDGNVAVVYLDGGKLTDALVVSEDTDEDVGQIILADNGKAFIVVAEGADDQVASLYYVWDDDAGHGFRGQAELVGIVSFDNFGEAGGSTVGDLRAVNFC